MAKITDRAAFEGETISGSFDAPEGTTAVGVKLASTNGTTKDIDAAKDDAGKWNFKADPTGLCGIVRWVAYATAEDGTKTAIASGAIYVRPLRSKYRAVVEAIDEQIQAWGSNPNQSISVGEINITYKTLDDLIGLRAYYEGKAKADEGGGAAGGAGPRIMKVRF